MVSRNILNGVFSPIERIVEMSASQYFGHELPKEVRLTYEQARWNGSSQLGAIGIAVNEGLCNLYVAGFFKTVNLGLKTVDYIEDGVRATLKLVDYIEDRIGK